MQQERFPYVDIFWDSRTDAPKLFHEQSLAPDDPLAETLAQIFTPQGEFNLPDLPAFMPWLEQLQSDKRVQIQEAVLEKIATRVMDQELEAAERWSPSLRNKVSQGYALPVPGRGDPASGLYRRAVLIRG